MLPIFFFLCNKTLYNFFANYPKFVTIYPLKLLYQRFKMDPDIENSDQDPLGIAQFPQFEKNVDLISTFPLPSKQTKNPKNRRSTVCLNSSKKNKSNTDLVFFPPPTTSLLDSPLPSQNETASDISSPRFFPSAYDDIFSLPQTKQQNHSNNDTKKISASVDNLVPNSVTLSLHQNNENSCLANNHIHNIEPPRPKQHQMFQLEVPNVDFSVLLNPNNPIKNEDLDCILASLNAQMIKERSDLDDFLSDSESHFLAITDIFDRFLLYSHYDANFHREMAIREILYEQLALKRSRRYQNISKYNIQLIDNFINFLNQFKNEQSLPFIDIDKFLSNYLINYEDKRLNILTINRHLACLENQINFLLQMNNITNNQNQSLFSKIINSSPSKSLRITDSLARMNMVPLKDGQIDFLSTVLSPQQKSGRIISRFLANIQVMSYPDLDVILSAIVPNPSSYVGIRNLLFDLAWTKMQFPFAEITHIQFPPIFDLTPRSFGATYLKEEHLDIPFEKLNYIRDSKNMFWPFAFTQGYYFTLMCYRNPFMIANGFWDLIQAVANTIQQLAIDSGEKNDEVEIGFDNVFPFLLSSLFAFGCSEILNTLEYCSQFLDYANDEHQQFAMTHCSGIVDQIRRIRADEFRLRAKSHKHSTL